MQVLLKCVIFFYKYVYLSSFLSKLEETLMNFLNMSKICTSGCHISSYFDHL